MNKLFKPILITLLSLVALILFVVGGYAIYLTLQYNRIPDNTALTVENPSTQTLTANTEYTAVTYNIGFGAYNHDFSFFMDSGVMEDGTPVKGKHSRAQSKDIVLTNTAGVIADTKAANPDFMLFQEVDLKADRSWDINQIQALQKAFPQDSSVYASNFHSAFLAYPITEPHGSVEAGLLTLSPYKISDATRRSYPVDESFPTKFFDLDRCFSLLRLPVENGGDLVLINSHMSAFDEGGLVRAAQMEMLCNIMAEEKAKGNWVIIGGDFNHALGNTEHSFSSQQKLPSWVYPFDETLLPEGFSVVKAENRTTVPTCRSSDIPYQQGVNYTTVLDGFIVSDNVTAAAENIDAGFLYSDHNPVKLSFSLS